MTATEVAPYLVRVIDISHHMPMMVWSEKVPEPLNNDIRQEEIVIKKFITGRS